ncbi:ABC transporter substrate-binding protein [Sphingosinicella sp. BN140058]|uniref:ABC transporter substrate-binding protein n=1 Tax=Sphingosinicella sp. BN140058 TaxID=1892855 RepID=UPI0010133C05|nr:ABC transporter substrate-binding protein [Sphingosinicella sp. BN140058]QAY76046.1 nitrate ABC transporter substrate-binding protein [Sphingosinicella sp. BN140058]
MKPRSILIGALVLLVLSAAAAFQFRGAGSSAASASAAPTTLTIASIAYPHQGQQRYQGQTAIIQQQGWLETELAKRGIKLAWFPVPTAVGGPMINEGFAAKRIDFASYGDFPAIIAASGGVDLRLVVPVGRGQNVYLVARKDLPARSIADLKGKRIGLHRGRPWELPFSKLVEQNGLKLSDFRIVNINPPASHAALASGDVDAVVLLSDAYLLEQKGVGRIIWSTKQAPEDWKMRAELFGRGDFVDANPELARIVAEAYIRAAHWSSLPANRDKVIEIAARAETPRSVVEAEYAEPRVRWRDRFSPLYDQAVIGHYREVADYTYRNGLVRSKVDVDKLLDRRFAGEALRDLKLEGHWPQPQQAAETSVARSGRS